ncbi:M23 family metallopeptidase [Lewinella sp. IMCC34191]|uniref:M23 family metallopeptidase n=1 Tax=Lewinella sp. IMCC34191 TaxID=2259172 RepID=UPI000E223304|nr:M23 family metallopeptidase [Lewinella sp. IMCC34191]
MIRIGFLFFCLYANGILAQKPLVEAVEDKGGYRIEVTNPSYLPVSMIFNFQLQNLRVDGGVDTLVVRPNSRQTVHRLWAVSPNRGYSFRYDYTYHTGDYRVRRYDTAYVYELPFRGTVPRRVIQGYNGRFSHTDRAALDFDMPEGTEIHAARPGRVVEVINNNESGCSDPICMNFSNLVRILHRDGTIAEYVHLRQHGTTVKIGQKVNNGDLIGYSGNTGFSTAPHLHFAVYQQRFGHRIFLPTTFRTAFGQVILVQGKSYSPQKSE